MQQQISINNHVFNFHCPADLESIWEQMDDEDPSWEENMPYWVEIWPAGVVLAEWLLDKKRRIDNQNCLDLGCGLGISTCAAAKSKARIIAVDNIWEALKYAQYNLRINNLDPVNLVHMDWQYPALKPQSFDFIWGADVLYESRFFLPLLKLFRCVLAPGGIIWLAAPDRRVTWRFVELLQKADWNYKIVHKKVPHYPPNNKKRIYLWELKKD